ncbi:MAG: hypothetical protein AAF203_08300 [Pseudomonadota bacterium]
MKIHFILICSLLLVGFTSQARTTRPRFSINNEEARAEASVPSQTIDLTPSARLIPLVEQGTDFVIGFEISAIQKGSKWDLWGVKEGDQIIEANGYSFDSSQSVYDFYKWTRAKDKVVFKKL